MGTEKETAKQEEQLAYIVQDICNTNAQFRRIEIGAVLQILRPLLQTMQTAASALELKDESPALFIGLAIAMTGSSTSDSTTGIIGPTFAGIVQSLSDALAGAMLPQADIGSQQFLPLLLRALFLAALIAAALAGDSRSVRGASSKEAREGAVFYYALSLLLAAHSDLLTTLFNGIADAFGATRQTRYVAGEFLSLSCVLFMTLLVADGGEDCAQELLENISPHLLTWCTHLHAFANDLGGSAEPNFILPQCIALLEQGKAALQRGDLHAFSKLPVEAIAVLGFSASDLQRDLAKIKECAAMLHYAFTTGLDDKTNIHTGIVQA